MLASGGPARADGDLSTVPRISLAEFKKQHDQDKVLVIDIRSRGRLSRRPHSGRPQRAPFRLDGALARLKATKKPIVAYCA